MTIEAKLDALTAAISGLTAAMTSKQPDTGAKTAPVAAVEPTKTTATPPATKTLTYDDIKVPFLALVKKNRDAALAALKPFGLDSLKPAKPEQFAAILAALNSALAA